MKTILVAVIIVFYYSTGICQQHLPCDCSFFRDDRKMAFDSLPDIESMRSKLVKAAFGDQGLPKSHDNVTRYEIGNPNHCNMADPIEFYRQQVSNWEEFMTSLQGDIGPNIDSAFRNNHMNPVHLKIKLPSLENSSQDCQTLPEYSTAYYYMSKEKSSGNAVLLHHGHYQGRNTSAVNRDFVRLIYALLSEGTDVALIFMPKNDPCFYFQQDSNHACIWDSKLKDSPGSPLRVFLTPASSMMAYLSDQAVTGRKYNRYHMIGLSGGGHLTTLYSALDKRITTSFSVAPGLMPFYLYGMNPESDVKDLDLSNSSVTLANPQDYYLLAASGRGRTHVEVWLKNDEGSANGETFFNQTRASPCPKCNNTLNPHRSDTLTYYEAGKDVEARIGKRLGRMGKFNIVIDLPRLTDYDSFKTEIRGYTGGYFTMCPSTECHLISKDILVRFMDTIRK